MPLVHGQNDQNHRVIVLTDIEADPDDTQSLVRLLLYANQIELKGLIATTSCWYKNKVNPESIARVIKAYGKVRPNLLQHEAGFPTEKYLLSLIKSGLPRYGMSGVGDEMDSEGSEWIMKELEKDDVRPLWISVWGGANTLAQALHKIERTKTKKEAARLIAKLRVYTISDQDDSGIWMRHQFPDLFYIVSPGDYYRRATWNAIGSVIPGIDNQRISNDWLAQHIQQDHGPLGAQYPDVSWVMEGDTPAFLSLIPNGLNDPEHPNHGGWGGRYELLLPDFSKQKQGRSGVPFEAETRKIWTDAPERYTPYVPNQYHRSIRKDTVHFHDNKTSLWRWRDDFQRDFAARMDWCTHSFQEANHPPMPILSHPEEIQLMSGESFTLDAFRSTDPDGDNLSFLWFPYPEAGTYQGNFQLREPENAHLVYGKAPEVAKPETIHIILKVTDKGSPALSRYKRIVLTITPD
ncbi:MAG: nucleoside hydrolase-like domain-containing protein [Bacteroidota bacterium]